MVTTKSAYVVNVISQGLGRLLTTLANFFVFVLIARHLGADTFGKFSYIVTFWALASTFAEFGTQTVLAKDIAQIKEDAGLYWGNFLILRTLLCLAAAAIALVMAFLIRRDLFAYIALGCLLIPFLSWRFYDPIFQVFHKPWYALAASVVFSVGHFGLMTAVIKGGGNLMSIVGVYLLTNAVYTLVLMRFSDTLIRPRWKIDKPILKKILKLSIPLGVASIYTIVNSRADIFLLAYLKSDDAVGVYNAAYRFLDLTALLAATLTIPLIPLFARWAATDRAVLKRHYAQIIEFLTVWTVPAALTVPLFSKALMSGFFGEHYADAAGVLDILAWVGVLVFYSLIGSIVNTVVEDIRHAYWNGAVAASLNICLNTFWIPSYGIAGAAGATLASEVAILGVSLYHVFKNLGNFLDGRKWAKIVLTNVFYFSLLHYGGLNNMPALKILLAFGCYLVLAILWKTLSWEVLRDLYLIAARRKVCSP